MDGRIVIGKFFTNSDDRYSSIQMDDLCFFNRALSEAEITMMNNWSDRNSLSIIIIIINLNFMKRSIHL